MSARLIATFSQLSEALGLTTRILQILASGPQAILSAHGLRVAHRAVRPQPQMDAIVEDAAQLVHARFPAPVHTFALRCDRSAQRRFFQDWWMLNLRRLTILRSVPAFSARLWSFAVLLGECKMALWSKTPRSRALYHSQHQLQTTVNLRNLRDSDDY